MATRWGLTAGAYKKWCFIFDKPLPVVITTNSPISDASYVRDVIRYANMNNLKGANWFNNVKVSAAEDGTLVISHRNGGMEVYPKLNIFEFIRTIQDNEYKDGDRFIVLDGHLAAKQVCENLQLSIIHLGNDVVEIRR